MFEKLEIFQMAGAMASHAASRQSMVAQNIAQADTPGYKARDLASFADTYKDQAGGMQIRATRTGHLMGSAAYSSTPRVIAGSGSESPNGNNVSLEGEMMKSTEISGEHRRALAIYQSSLGIIRASLGRR